MWFLCTRGTATGTVVKTKQHCCQKYGKSYDPKSYAFTSALP